MSLCRNCTHAPSDCEWVACPWTRAEKAEADNARLTADLAAARTQAELWLITIEAHCLEIADPSWGAGSKYAKELSACIKANVAEIRQALSTDHPGAAMEM